MTPTHKTTERFARLVCGECNEMFRGSGERFLTEQQYEQQLSDSNRGWRCPACHCYPCYWDDDYFELPVANALEAAEKEKKVCAHKNHKLIGFDQFSKTHKCKDCGETFTVQDSA